MNNFSNVTLEQESLLGTGCNFYHVFGLVQFMSYLIIFAIVIGIIIRFVIRWKKIKTSTLEEKEKAIESKKTIKGLIYGLILCGICLFIISVVKMIVFTADKPIIYLYPETPQEVTVKLGYKDKITVSYPKYTTGWNVLANPNGDLIDLDTNKKLYSLYYESENTHKFKIEKDGFIVKGEDVVEFLEDKLEILGLNYKEAEEFIIYWLPILERNNYNYIRFATMEEINNNMPLEFSVQPDSLIRVLMVYKGLNKPIEVEEQKLETPERIGFVAVEWGGTEIK